MVYLLLEIEVCADDLIARQSFFLKEGFRVATLLAYKRKSGHF